MPRHAEAEDEPRSEDAGGHDLRDGEGGVGERGGGDGLHGLHGHRHAVDEAGGRVVDAGEDEGRAQVQVPGERQGEHDGNVGAQVAHGAVQLRPHRPEGQVLTRAHKQGPWPPPRRTGDGGALPFEIDVGIGVGGLHGRGHGSSLLSAAAQRFISSSCLVSLSCFADFSTFLYTYSLHRVNIYSPLDYCIFTIKSKCYDCVEINLSKSSITE
jgi:hypothetical protein